jgi:hypothetical protein
MKPDERRASLRIRLQRFIAQNFTYDEDRRKRAIVSVRLSMGDYVKDDFTRRKILGWLFIGQGHSLSTSNLTDAQLETLKVWLQILPAGGSGEWTISEIAIGELRQMAALVDGKLDNPTLPEIDPEPYGPMVQEAVNQGGQVQNAQPAGQVPPVPSQPKPQQPAGTNVRKEKKYFQFE